MTRPVEEFTTCLELSAQGLNPSQISRRTRIPRATVRDWVRGNVRQARQQPEGACPTCGHPDHVWAELPDAYVYLLGIYLGDGCISTHARGVYRLRVVLDEKYPLIVDEVASAIWSVRPANRVGRRHLPKNCVEVSAYSRAWPCLFPQHGPGKKHERRIQLESWQWGLVERRPELLLRGLVHSDGCRFVNTGRGGWRSPRYSFTNLSQDVRMIFFETCDLLDIHATWARPSTIYVSRKKDVARMDRFIGPKR